MPRLPQLLANAEAEGWRNWITCEADEKAVLNGGYFDVLAAERVFNFFEKFLRHSKGKWGGKPFVLAPWQKEKIVGPLFGWKREDKARRFRRAHIEIAKKNGKSTMASGIGVYMLVGDKEPGAEVYSAATKKDQASIVHDEAIKMVDASAGLRKHLKINRATRVISHLSSYSKYAVLAADAEGSEGLNIHCLIADELHVWKGRKFWDSLRYGYAARTQPLCFVITTAGLYNPTSLGWTEHEYALAVQNGDQEDEKFYSYVVAAEAEDDILDPDTHRKANPGYGDMVDPEEIMEAAKDAKAKPVELGAFNRYRLNLWTQTMDSFFNMEAWNACDEEVDEADLLGRSCFGGLDLASRSDVAAWVLLFPPTEFDEKWRVLPRLFCPQATAEEREAKQNVPYATWGRQGHLILTAGDTIDYETIEMQIIADSVKFDIVDAGADEWNLAYLHQKLAAAVEELEILKFQQNLRAMTPPMTEILEMVRIGVLAHGGHPVLSWMAANLVAYRDGNDNMKPMKNQSADKIDGIVALFMALGRAMVSPGKTGSIYDKQGLFSA